MRIGRLVSTATCAGDLAEGKSTSFASSGKCKRKCADSLVSSCRCTKPDQPDEYVSQYLQESMGSYRYIVV